MNRVENRKTNLYIYGQLIWHKGANNVNSFVDYIQNILLNQISLNSPKFLPWEEYTTAKFETFRYFWINLQIGKKKVFCKVMLVCVGVCMSAALREKCRFFYFNLTVKCWTNLAQVAWIEFQFMGPVNIKIFRLKKYQ